MTHFGKPWLKFSVTITSTRKKQFKIGTPQKDFLKMCPKTILLLTISCEKSSVSFKISWPYTVIVS